MQTLPLAVSTYASAALQLVPLAVLCLLYCSRTRTLAAKDPVAAWRQACFYGSFIVIAVALAPLGAAGRELLWVHTIEQFLLGDIAALLIVLGLSGPVLAPMLRIRVFDRLSALAHPAVAFPLWAVDLYLWHLPTFYEAALHHTGISVLEHAMIVGFGINMWMCLLGPLPTPSWFGNLGKLIYVVAVRVAGATLGNIFLWSGTVFYPYYLKGEAHFRISPLADQNIAGAIMTAEDAILTLCLFYWLFRRNAWELARTQDAPKRARSRELQPAEARAGTPERS